MTLDEFLNEIYKAKIDSKSPSINEWRVKAETGQIVIINPDRNVHDVVIWTGI